jgi:hypothetical protein
VAQFALPRRLAFAPLPFAALTLPDLVVFDVGVSFTITKTLILASLIRAARDKTFVWSFKNKLDAVFMAWACWMVLSGFGHSPKDHNPVTVRCSVAYDMFGAYLYARAYLGTYEKVLLFCRFVVLCMIPLAVMMTYERMTTFNIPWSVMTGDAAHALSREGRVRANGPFRHPILAGTVGASFCILLTFLIKKNLKRALIVGLPCGVVVFCSASSGPIMTLATGVGALALWKWRQNLKTIRTLAICSIVGLHFVMESPVWYLIARIDLAGGSTGWHRAELITKAIKHFDRWWLIGTDYTRDWIAYGIAWSDDMVDITNLYIQMGVRGGLLLMLLFIGIILRSFQTLGRRMAISRETKDQREFALWCIGASLFAHCVNFLTVTYFDQALILFCITIGLIPGACSPVVKGRVNETPKVTENAALLKR